MAKTQQASNPSISSGDEMPSLSIGLCNCCVLRKATRRISQLYDEALNSYGIKVTQRFILEHVAQSGAPNVSELADMMAMDRSVMTRNLQPLERAGWVKLLIDPDDRRSRHIALTASGRAKLAETFEAWRAAQACFERVIGRRTAAELRVTLGHIGSDDFASAYQKDFASS